MLDKLKDFINIAPDKDWHMTVSYPFVGYRKGDTYVIFKRLEDGTFERLLQRRSGDPNDKKVYSYIEVIKEGDKKWPTNTESWSRSLK